MIPLVLAVAGSMGLSGCRKNSDEENMVMDAGPSVETAVRTDIENVYTAKGKIISGQESSMNAKGASGSDALIIDQVYVQVGDLVKAGDILYTLDLTDTQKDLAMKEQQQAISDQQNALTQSKPTGSFRSAGRLRRSVHVGHEQPAPKRGGYQQGDRTAGAGSAEASGV